MKKEKKIGQLLREYFVFYGIIPAFTISVLLLGFVFVFQQYLFKREVRISNQQAVQQLEQELDAQKDFLRDFSQSPKVLEYFLGAGNASMLYEDFYAYNRDTDLKCVMNLLGRDSRVLSSSLKFSEEYSQAGLILITERIKKKYPDVLDESNLIEYPSGILSVYTLGAAVRDGEEIVGYVMVQTLEEGLQRVLKSGTMLRQLTVDRFDRIISIQNDMDHRLKERFLPDQDPVFTGVNEDKYYFVNGTLPGYGITIYTAGTWNSIRSSYVMSILFSAVVLIHLIFLVNNISRKVSKKVTEPIQNLVQAFSHLKEGETQHMAAASDHVEEFRFLTEEYNHMLNQLNQLMKRNEELSEIRRVSEIKQLEAQFDPHFFLNMLESLRYMSLMGREDTEKMILSLSGILRYSLYNKDQYSSVVKDMKYVEDYLYLQKTRIGSNFTYEIHLEEEVKENIVPKLLIQPLIENSIKHGYQGVPGFHVTVTAYKQEGDIYFQVRDNGKGITREKARELMDTLMEDPVEHIGLGNIHKRLVYMHGEGYGIQNIDGSYGFMVTVKVKGEEKEE